jgi:hypothetical protein
MSVHVQSLVDVLTFELSMGNGGAMVESARFAKDFKNRDARLSSDRGLLRGTRAFSRAQGRRECEVSKPLE